MVCRIDVLWLVADVLSHFLSWNLLIALDEDVDMLLFPLQFAGEADEEIDNLLLHLGFFKVDANHVAEKLIDGVIGTRELVPNLIATAEPTTLLLVGKNLVLINIALAENHTAESIFSILLGTLELFDIHAIALHDLLHGELVDIDLDEELMLKSPMHHIIDEGTAGLWRMIRERSLGVFWSSCLQLLDDSDFIEVLLHGPQLPSFQSVS